MLSFECDYLEGAHPAILEKLMETNMEQLEGYGVDHYSEEAKDKIREACGKRDADVFFFAGGTQTNVTVIDSILKRYEGIIATDTSHINNHEAGGVEFTGHKVLTLPNKNGKIDPDDLINLLKDFYDDESLEHIVFPGGVYISHPTELGTLYTKSELQTIAKICKEYEMPLYLDGARLGYGLASDQTDVTLKDIADIVDVFYIGGTKLGALCGEAVVFPKGNAPKHFFTIMKQRGNVMAKGRITALQFHTLFTDDLYMRISKNALEMAKLLKKAFSDRGIEFFVDSPTNLQFFVMEDDYMNKLHDMVSFEITGKHSPGKHIVRFVTSWATKPEYIKTLEECLDKAK